MTLRIMGALMVVGACGGFGLSLARESKREEYMLEQIIRVIEYMECELQYHLTALPDLCRGAAKEVTGEIQLILLAMGKELDYNIAPDAASCLGLVLSGKKDLPPRVQKILIKLSRSLGRFDLDGQIKGLKSVHKSCSRELKELEWNHDERLRSYRTLGFCAGTALVILFM